MKKIILPIKNKLWAIKPKRFDINGCYNTSILRSIIYKVRKQI